MFGRRNLVKVSPRCGLTGMIQWIRSCTVGDPKYLFEFSRFLDRSQKIVISHSLKKAEWKNSRIMKGDLARLIARLKRESGKAMIVDAGPSVVHAFIQGGVADDYSTLVMTVS